MQIMEVNSWSRSWHPNLNFSNAIAFIKSCNKNKVCCPHYGSKSFLIKLLAIHYTMKYCMFLQCAWLINRSQNSIVSIMTRPWARRSGIQIPAGKSDPIFHTIHTSYESHPNLCSRVFGFFLGGKAAEAWSWPLTSI